MNGELKELLDKMASDIIDLKDAVNKLVRWTEEQREFNTRVLLWQHETSIRLDRMEIRLDRVEARLERVETRLERVEDKTTN